MLSKPPSPPMKDAPSVRTSSVTSLQGSITTRRKEIKQRFLHITLTIPTV
jgi:hypothetical protein